VYIALAGLLAIALGALALAAAPRQAVPAGIRDYVRLSRANLALTGLGILSALGFLFLYNALI
jgi:hypothetical protein